MANKFLNDTGLQYLINKIKEMFVDKSTTQTANTIFAGPSSGGATQPSFRTLVSADIPNNLSANTSGNAATATKLKTPRNLKVALGSTTDVTFDGSASQNSIPVSGTLAVANGGTGATSLDTITVGAATKLGSSTIGGGTKPIYLNSGTATASSSTVGSSTKPIYLNSGTITASSSTVGSSTKPIYLNSGTITAVSYGLNSTVNSGTTNKLAYYSGANAISSYTTTVGSANQICYLSAGVPTSGIKISYGSTLPTSGSNGDIFILI